MKKPICVYVDNSNIFHEGQRFAEKFKKEDRYGFRLHFPNFLNVLVSSEKPNEVVWGGSVPPPDDTVWSKLTALGVDPVLIPRGPGGENETVDNSIQLYMHRHASIGNRRERSSSQLAMVSDTTRNRDSCMRLKVSYRTVGRCGC